MEHAAKNNLIVRALSGILVVAAVVGAALAGCWTFGMLIMVIGGFSIFELGRLARMIKMNWFLTVSLCLIWIVLPLMLLMRLYVWLGSPWPALWYIFIIWMNDIGAYLVGVTLGRHKGFDRKLCPQVSPLKTWTGFFGGMLFGVGVGVLAAVVMDWNVWFWVGLAMIAVVTGVAGDLVESMFKRTAGVKDSGTLIPGHGGMLDRFDALLFSAPFVFAYFFIFAV